MPHFIIDCSEEILAQRKPEEIMQAVYNMAEASGLFAINDIKVRIQPYKHYRLGEDKKEFIHVFAYIMEGRSIDQKARLSRKVIEKLNSLFPDLSILSMNIYDFEKATYFNKAQLNTPDSYPQFDLNYRGEDVMELYRHEFVFKLFSKENYKRLALSALFLVLIALCIIVGFERKEYYLMLILFLAGLGYQITNILKPYWKIREKERKIRNWVDSIKVYKTHRIVFGDRLFRYHRDNEVYTYEIDKIKKSYHTDKYFYLVLTDDVDILLPSRSFEAGKYKEFTDLIDRMTSRN